MNNGKMPESWNLSESGHILVQIILMTQITKDDYVLLVVWGNISQVYYNNV